MFYRFIRRFLCIVVRVLWRVKITGRENIPANGAVVCSNHTAFHDPVFGIIAFKKDDPLIIMIKREIDQTPVLGWILRKMKAVPVERDGTDLKAIKRCMEHLRGGSKLYIFPEGHRVHAGERGEPKSGAALMAHRCAVPILPVYITAGSKPLFSRVEVKIGRPYYIISEEKKPGGEFYHRESLKIMESVAGLCVKS